MQCRRGTLGDDSDMTVKRTSPEAESIRSLEQRNPLRFLSPSLCRSLSASFPLSFSSPVSPLPSSPPFHLAFVPDRPCPSIIAADMGAGALVFGQPSEIIRREREREGERKKSVRSPCRPRPIPTWSGRSTDLLESQCPSQSAGARATPNLGGESRDKLRCLAGSAVRSITHRPSTVLSWHIHTRTHERTYVLGNV